MQTAIDDPAEQAKRVAAAHARVIDVLDGPAEAARLLGLSDAMTGLIRKGKRRLPATLAPTVERITAARGSVVRCEELWPDVEWDVLRMQAGELSAEERADA